jgi:hypothetical protein
MNEALFALVVFCCLAGASLGALVLHAKLPAQQREEDTQGVVRLIANIFVVMTSLVLGLMISSAKGRYDAVNRDVHTFAIGLIMLDKLLVLYGPEAAEARKHLLVYSEQALHTKWETQDPLAGAHKSAEHLLNDVGTSLRAIRPTDDARLSVWNDAREQYRKLLELRWVLVEQAEGSIPKPLMRLLIGWLALVFASFGFRAPLNAVVVTGLVLASALMTGAIYLIVDMDAPFQGPIQISSAPLERAIAEMRR